MTCSLCEHIKLISIKTPIDLNKAIVNLQGAIQKKIVKSIGRGTHFSDPFYLLAKNQWGDCVDNYFCCEHCGQLFHLHAETYHGGGGELEKVNLIKEQLIAD